MTKRSPNSTPSHSVAGEVSKKKEKTVTRKPITAEYQSPVVRGIAHDTFTTRPNTDRIARDFGLRRLDAVDAIAYEIHRRLARVETILGFPSHEAVPFRSVRSSILQIKGRAA